MWDRHLYLVNVCIIQKNRSAWLKRDYDGKSVKVVQWEIIKSIEVNQSKLNLSNSAKFSRPFITDDVLRVFLLFYLIVFCFQWAARFNRRSCFENVFFSRNLKTSFLLCLDTYGEDIMTEDYEMESSSEALTTELEEGQVLQDAELVCVDQEEMDRLAAEGK